MQTTPVLSVNGFLDAGGVKNMIQSKKYLKGSKDLWDFLLDGVTHHEFTLCALGGLIDHLSRLMVCAFFSVIFFGYNSMQFS